jgi:LPXTG-motif cell wall-anchored protein
MRRFPFARRALLAATACSAVVLPVVVAAPAAWAEAPSPSACSGLYHGTPTGTLAITTSPPSGAVLHPGDEVEVTATWDTADWPGPVLHKVLDCLLVNGSVDYDHSSQEKPTDNDGLYRYRFTVPKGVGRICDRVRLSGRLVDGGDLVVQKSNTICFSFAAAGGTSVTGGPTEATTQAATPTDEGTPTPLQPAEPVTEAPTPTANPAPTLTDAASPAPPLELSASVVPTLPRTGSDTLLLTWLGALLVLLGGVALAARAALSGS